MERAGVGQRRKNIENHLDDVCESDYSEPKGTFWGDVRVPIMEAGKGGNGGMERIHKPGRNTE